MKRKVIIVFVLLSLVTVSLFAFGLFSRKTHDYKFDTVTVIRGSITNVVTATGTIQAIKTVNVGTQVSGIIRRRPLIL